MMSVSCSLGSPNDEMGGAAILSDFRPESFGFVPAQISFTVLMQHLEHMSSQAQPQQTGIRFWPGMRCASVRKAHASPLPIAHGKLHSWQCSQPLQARAASPSIRDDSMRLLHCTVRFCTLRRGVLVLGKTCKSRGALPCSIRRHALSSFALKYFVVVPQRTWDCSAGTSVAAQLCKRPCIY